MAEQGESLCAQRATMEELSRALLRCQGEKEVVEEHVARLTQQLKEVSWWESERWVVSGSEGVCV